MRQQHLLETAEEFKPRVAAIIRAKPEQIPGVPRPHSVSVRRKKSGRRTKERSVDRFGVMQVYEVRPRKDHRGFDLISDALPFGRSWYAGPNAVANAIGYAEHRSRSHDAVICVYDAAGDVIETQEHKGDFKEW